MIKAIIIDLDGTTLPRNWHQISEENRVALEEAGQQGVVRILATGRSVFSLNNTLPEGLPVDYMVFSSGAGIMTKRFFSPGNYRPKKHETLLPISGNTI